MIKTNYHVHTTFCDGKNTPEEMVIAAIEKGIKILGFSSHSMYPFSSDWHIPSKDHSSYIAEIDRLKEKYSGKIKLYSGFEADYISGVSSPSFERFSVFHPDFLIGSVHFVPGTKGFFEADGSFDSVTEGIKLYFKGNTKKAVQEYFALEKEMLRKCSFTFLSHPDLIRKQNAKGNHLFDETSSWYKSEIKSLAKEIKKSGICVEVNTGGLLRSGMESPYPSKEFLSLLHDLNVPITINSDAHSVEGIDWWFLEAIDYVKKAGYTSLSYFDDGKIKTQSIN